MGVSDPGCQEGIQDIGTCLKNQTGIQDVMFDHLARPADGVWRFDDEFVEYSTASKEHMKVYVSRQLRIIIDVYQSMQVGSSSQITLLNEKQLIVQ
eukprot:6179155-Pleurochrysis_carterae.AAC.1